MAGRPKGSPNKYASKPFRDALRMEVADAGKKHRRLRKIAEKLADKAAEGDVAAIREIADRLDGKPVRSVEVSGGLVLTHEEALEALERLE